jgi:hypothetical protein
MNVQLFQALENLFQACADLPLEEMDRMEKEINVASLALEMTALQTPPNTRKGKLMIFDYIYRWKNNTKRATMYKRVCRVIARGKLNSCLIEFLNGQREVVSRNSIRKEKPCSKNSD